MTDKGESLTDDERSVARRTLLKGAVGVGAAAAVYSAPNIETLGFAPAAAEGTRLIILSDEADDCNSNSGNIGTVVYCDPPEGDATCCGQAWCDNGKFEEFTFSDPIPNCAEIVVGVLHNSCSVDATEKNPSIGQAYIRVVSSSGSACGDCDVLEGVLVSSSGRVPQGAPLDNGPACGGVDISVACDDPRVLASSRLAVRISCDTFV